MLISGTRRSIQMVACFFLTGDDTMQQFGAHVASDTDWQQAATDRGTLRPLVVVHTEELERRCSADEHRCFHDLREAALNPSSRSCDIPLSASLITAVMNGTLRDLTAKKETPVPDELGESSQADVETLRKELREAVTVFSTTRQFLLSKSQQNSAAAACLQKIDDAQQRWQTMLSRTS